MPRHWPIETRIGALRQLAANGCDYRETSEAMGISAVTLRSWVKRYGLPKPARNRPQAAQEGPREASGYAGPGSVPGRRDGEQDAPPPPPHRLSGAGGGGVSSLVDLERTAYLRDRVDLVERILRGMLKADSPTYSAMRPLLHLQSDLHREHVEIERAEGSRLDLSTDPRQLASAVEGMGRLLEILGADLDTPDTLDLSGLEDILGELDEDMASEGDA